ncbi:MAG: penicillin-binding protein 2 [Endomicrobiia bacterium]|nr:penicillin-binding protein 2 [Endomicrobiaceae bacterium]
MSWSNDDKSTYNSFMDKYKNLFILFVLLFLLLSLKLFYLQVIQGTFYRNVANHQRLNTTHERAYRGIIYDANEKILVGNESNYVALFYPFEQQYLPSEETVEQLNQILNRDIKPFIDKGWRYGRVVKIADSLTLDEVFKIQEKKLFLPGIMVVKEPKRQYFDSIENAHVTGYVGEVSADELETLETDGYKAGDYIGRGGIEQSYDKYLRGIDGGLDLEVNAKGQHQKAFSHRAPIIGNSVYLTIDTELQKVAYEALKNTTTSKGAAVVIDVRTGAVKALVSCPSYDTNKVFTNEYRKYLKDKKLPLFNRAIQALYPPGSIFKIITFIAAMEYLKLNPNHIEECTGKFELGDRVYACSSKAGHGKINLITAMTFSCNVYFYKLGLDLGIRVLGKYAKLFYLGEPTGIDIPAEKKGFVPTPEWKKAKMKMIWLKGDTVIFSIGQGALWVTPLQMAATMTAVANKGVYYKPYLVEKIIDVENNNTVYSHLPETKEKIIIADNVWEQLNTALINVVEEGTAKRTKFSTMKVAAKTGTAQNPHGEDHAWVVAYAPADNPQIALAVIVENGGSGGIISVPVAREILKKYFNIQEDDGNTVNQKVHKER